MYLEVKSKTSSFINIYILTSEYTYHISMLNYTKLSDQLLWNTSRYVISYNIKSGWYYFCVILVICKMDIRLRRKNQQQLSFPI